MKIIFIKANTVKLLGAPWKKCTFRALLPFFGREGGREGNASLSKIK
jgi:hypothetical protein